MNGSTKYCIQEYWKISHADRGRRYKNTRKLDSVAQLSLMAARYLTLCEWKLMYND